MKFKVTFVIEIDDIDDDPDYDTYEIAQIALSQLVEEDGNGDLIHYFSVEPIKTDT